MNDPKQTMEDVEKEARSMSWQELVELVVLLNAGNLAKQQYIEGLEFLLAKKDSTKSDVATVVTPVP